ncbi:MAG: hypothetical protein LC798_15520 [Chloroflexi bacterium]|nr:hypothetical protein [Chloroflexota bacterium]
MKRSGLRPDPETTRAFVERSRRPRAATAPSDFRDDHGGLLPVHALPLRREMPRATVPVEPARKVRVPTGVRAAPTSAGCIVPPNASTTRHRTIR